uniref:Uncharacterized protein n=1 Tax=Rhizophora mucronata TaxID=61149 RepID=A0A2P2QS00_RHIMU
MGSLVQIVNTFKETSFCSENSKGEKNISFWYLFFEI